MTLDFSEEGKLIINMEDSIDTMLNGLPKNRNGVATTSAGDHLFKTHNATPKLNIKRGQGCATAPRTFSVCEKNVAGLTYGQLYQS